MRTAIISQRKLYSLHPATERKVRNVIGEDELFTDYSTHHLFPKASFRNNLWLEDHIALGEFDRLVVLCYRNDTQLIKKAIEKGLDIVLFKESASV